MSHRGHTPTYLGPLPQSAAPILNTTPGPPDNHRGIDSYMDRFRIRPASRPGTPVDGSSTKSTRETPGSHSPTSVASSIFTGSPAATANHAATIPTTAPSDAGTSKTSTSTPPVSGRVKACERCRIWKKKCTRHPKVPTKCVNCINAGAECSLRALTTSQTGLRARLAWMESFINSQGLLGSDHPIEHVPTGSDLSQLAVTHHSGHLSDTAVTDHDETMTDSHPILPPQPQPKFNHGFTAVNRTALPQEPVPRVSQTVPQRISKDTYRVLLDAYYLDVGRGYPFICRTRAAALMEQAGPTIPRNISMDLKDTGSVVLGLMVAIGHSSLRRVGKLPFEAEGLEFIVQYKEILAQCLLNESKTTLEILLLLALYALTDPQGPSCQPIIDVLGRQAVRLRLGQRDTLDEAVTEDEAEHSHRLFWSIYIVDRMMAVSCGLPVALDVTNADIPMPSLTINEFAAPNQTDSVAMLQVTRQLVHLRQLEDRIIHRIHLRPREETAQLTRTDRQTIIKSLRTDIENWYSHGCLLKPTEHDNVAIHITVSWLASRYYNLLLLLYYPSPFNPGTLLLSRHELLSLAQKHIQANTIRLNTRQLPLNEPTLCRLLPIVLVLLHSFLHHRSANGPFAARDEVLCCATILSAYPPAWTTAHRAADMVRQLGALITKCTAYDEMPFAKGAGNASLSGADWERLREVRAGLVGLAREVLGRGSAFLAMEHWEVDDDDEPVNSTRERRLDGRLDEPYREVHLDHEEQPIPHDKRHMVVGDLL